MKILFTLFYFHIKLKTRFYPTVHLVLIQTGNKSSIHFKIDRKLNYHL